MPILKQTAYTTSDKTVHATIEAAQAHELRAILAESMPEKSEWHDDVMDTLADNLVERKDRIIDLLTMKPSSRPAARKVNRKKKGVTVETPVTNVT